MHTKKCLAQAMRSTIDQWEKSPASLVNARTFDTLLRDGSVVTSMYDSLADGSIECTCEAKQS